MEIHEVTKCQNCEQERTQSLPYFWRKVDVCEKGTTKATKCVAIYCGLCGRTITILPEALFPAAED